MQVIRTSDEDGRQGRGPRRLEATLHRLLDPAARRRGFIEGRVFRAWPAIVGDDIAALCQPIRLSPGSGGGSGVLHVRVSGSAGLELQHTEPLVLQRINAYFGRAVVGRLRLTQAPAPLPPEPARLPARHLTGSEIEAIARSVDAITHPALREALRTLGEAVRAQASADIHNAFSTPPPALRHRT
ncbi:DUF721 domain-containing protein [Marinivivus vitaminiproducens]|uniref:DUF721 domain-containing protein n=1 Tax=Marinivivus vitaminiproducens TaxID=3035935 RepID=UPI0027A69C5E|nr:DciA family protein [Geminicoccaceae bacterium SCSIO 64248]